MLHGPIVVRDRPGIVTSRPVLLEDDAEILSQDDDLRAYARYGAPRHARPAVTVRWTPAHLELEILDRGAPAVTGPEAATGLVGMEERVRLYEGELRTGRRAGGGFEVVARLPL